MTNYKEYIYAVYREKGFSKAAQKLYVSQPWLSATIKKAEQELGWKAERDLDKMCEDSWRWQKNNPEGYVE